MNNIAKIIIIIFSPLLFFGFLFLFGWFIGWLVWKETVEETSEGYLESLKNFFLLLIGKY